MHKKTFSLLIIGALLIPNASFANFKDVGTTHLYQQAINSLAKDGCISGYSDGTFKPDNTINRAETLKLIQTCLDIPKIYSEEIFQIPAGASYILNGQEFKLDKDSEMKIKVPFNPTTYPDLEFRDIDNTEWFIPILKEALVREIITGYADNTIKATRTVAKGEFFAMLFRVVPKELQKTDLSKDLAKDSLIGQWYNEPLTFAVQNKIIGLDSEGNVNPFRELTRGQVAHFIYLYKNWLKPQIASTTTPTPAPAPVPTTPAPVAIANTNTLQVGQKQTGKASFVGRTIYTEKLVAAHPTLPKGSLVTVTNPKTQKYAQVRIIDRGPDQNIHPDRIIDLSYDAFEAIGDISSGVLEVELVVNQIPA